MTRRLFRSLIPAFMLALIAGQAWAEVTVTFYAHPGARVRGGYLLFPHAYVHAQGTVDATGEAVDWSAGFTAESPGPHLLFVRGGGVVASPDARYVDEGQPFLSLTVDDATWHALRARADWWNSPEGSVYDLRRRNCITFIADLARVAGLRTAPEPSMKPGTFLEATAALNPAAAWREEAVVSPAPSPVTAARPGSEANRPGAQP
ncbi:MAG: hypothetical protein QME55_06470 [Brevundimonas sp.]|uniref:hypothetical protein n=1 Tax=Brevundimonas sp. TaxID=1871086 RepID=UPI0026275CF3|nr:hypothetical protein [Brevundimonas sp.]MDI6624356.1 hypothetical protein [Brevundimonas sp.]MDQ7813724.1 hypothetical protein [Brevundimonas sp.]